LQLTWFPPHETDFFHANFDAQQLRGERHRQLFFQYAEKAGNLLGFVIAINSRLLDHLIQPSFGDGFVLLRVRLFIMFCFPHSILLCRFRAEKPVQDILTGSLVSMKFLWNASLIICPARSLENMRVPGDWKDPLAAVRLLIRSPFIPSQRRVTADLAVLRNVFVAALADEAWFAHIAQGGKAERLSQRLAEWQVPYTSCTAPLTAES
jgi:hypothetical protein